MPLKLRDGEWEKKISKMTPNELRIVRSTNFALGEGCNSKIEKSKFSNKQAGEAFLHFWCSNRFGWCALHRRASAWVHPQSEVQRRQKIFEQLWTVCTLFERVKGSSIACRVYSIQCRLEMQSFQFGSLAFITSLKVWTRVQPLNSHRVQWQISKSWSDRKALYR